MYYASSTYERDERFKGLGNGAFIVFCLLGIFAFPFCFLGCIVTGCCWMYSYDCVQKCKGLIVFLFGVACIAILFISSNIIYISQVGEDCSIISPVEAPFCTSIVGTKNLVFASRDFETVALADQYARDEFTRHSRDIPVNETSYAELKTLICKSVFPRCLLSLPMFPCRSACSAFQDASHFCDSSSIVLCDPVISQFSPVQLGILISFAILLGCGLICCVFFLVGCVTKRRKKPWVEEDEEYLQRKALFTSAYSISHSYGADEYAD